MSKPISANNPAQRRERVKTFAVDNLVAILFLALSIGGFILARMRMDALLYQLMGRMARNLFLILALIIPIVAGMGINFAITIGAMAAQIAMLLVLNWKIPGVGGFFLACVIAVPIATLFGYLVGFLLNKMKGKEMIGSMFLGYFANGLYQLLFLYIFGNLIPMQNPDLIIVGSTGIRSTIDLSVPYGFKGALDNMLKVNFTTALYVFCGASAIYLLVSFFRKKRSVKQTFIPLALLTLAVIAVQFEGVAKAFTMSKVPVATFALIGLLCLFNVAIMRTRLGQQFRAVGQSQPVANAAGINVNRVRIIAIMISTVFAAIGQVIYLQNLGQIQTYSAHEQVGLYAGAAILVGGASIVRATNKQAILGCILFHTLFTIVTSGGNKLFAKPDAAEHFRVFISFGAIALALVLHGLKNRTKSPAELIREAARKG